VAIAPQQPPAGWVQWTAPSADPPTPTTPGGNLHAPVPLPLPPPLAPNPPIPDPHPSPSAPAEIPFDEIPISEISFGKRVGTGAFGEVLKAVYQAGGLLRRSTQPALTLLGLLFASV
jgi:sterile alpha motif and leucine zipper-containing kinase AZK